MSKDHNEDATPVNVPVVKTITSDGRLIYDVASIIWSEAGKKHLDSLIENTLPSSSEPK